jgi:glycine dehydrogenase
MIAIRQGEAALEPNNVLKNAPHTLNMLTANTWVLPTQKKQPIH